MIFAAGRCRWEHSHRTFVRQQQVSILPFLRMAWHGMAWHGAVAQVLEAEKPYLEDSSSASRCLRKLACIMRHVRFSMRSWLGKLCFVLLKKRQT